MIRQTFVRKSCCWIGIVGLLAAVGGGCADENAGRDAFSKPATESETGSASTSTNSAGKPPAEATPADTTPVAAKPTDAPSANGGDAESSNATAHKTDADKADADKASDIGAPAALGHERIQAGWIALFDGHSLFGWKPNSDANWSVKDGIITADSGKPGLLVTPVRFADFELVCDWRLAKGGNSGVFLRTPFEPKNPAVDCYELNMCDTHPAFPTGSLVARVKPTEPIIGEDAAWHTFHVRCEGTKINVTCDGKPALDYEDAGEKPLRAGFIGLQMNGGKIEFRNVFLKPLGTRPLFNGADLAGWKVVPGSKSTFDVKDGAIHVENGPGFLETEATFGDFVLQGQARTNGDRLNSGVFFRAQPGTEKAPSNGYEFQIQNGFENGDRTQPADFGTGAIFRRAKARRVVANDRAWFYWTLVADGPTFATWVDGYPVVTWTDDREPNDNPRQGKRLEAGHLSLQGHDPTTNLDFKSFNAAPIEPNP